MAIEDMNAQSGDRRQKVKLSCWRRTTRPIPNKARQLPRSCGCQGCGRDRSPRGTNDSFEIFDSVGTITGAATNPNLTQFIQDRSASSLMTMRLVPVWPRTADTLKLKTVAVVDDRTALWPVWQMFKRVAAGEGHQGRR